MKPERLIEDLTLVPLPAWWENPWVLLAIPVVSGIAAYLLRRWWLGRPPAPAPGTPTPAGPPPEEAFLARLAELRARRAAWIPHPFAVEVSDILRGYLEARFGFAVRFQTSREFLGTASRDARLSGDQQAVLGDFLGGCDRIKFARAEAGDPALLALLDAADGFVRQCAGSQGTGPGGGRP